MKTTITIILISVFLLSLQTEKADKKNLIVGHWKEFGYKFHDDTVMKSVSEECALKTMTFGNDWTYEESMYCLTSGGKWFFNKDQTKIGFTLDTFNGMKTPSSSDTMRIANIIIIKLTRDTLIYGQEAYYGEKGIYGHDDYYFVRQK